jgi:hypothetical protein
MTSRIAVRAGCAKSGEYNLEPGARLTRLLSLPIELKDAQVELVHAGGSEVAGMVCGALVGGVLLGGLGAAAGALLGGRDTVLFEAKWPDGRSLVAQCSSVAYQEFVIAHYAANSPHPPAPYVELSTTLLTLLIACAGLWLFVRCAT